jgi:hypothetical protein
VGSNESFEKEARRLYRTALETEVAPALSMLGFEIKGKGGYSLQWNDAFEFVTNMSESKSNKFGAQRFEVLFSIWLMQSEDRHVRGIWLPIPRDWRFDSLEEMDGVGQRLLEGVLNSAVPLAEEKWGAPTNSELAAMAARTDLEAARSMGAWHIPGSGY